MVTCVLSVSHYYSVGIVCGIVIDTVNMDCSAPHYYDYCHHLHAI